MFKSITLSKLLLLLMLSFGVGVSAQTNYVATVEIDVWLRVGPGTEWRRLDIIGAGTTVAVDGRDFSAGWIRGITQNGQVGWMSATYLSITPDAVGTLPVIEREAPITVGAPAAGAAVTVPDAPAAAEPQAAAPAGGSASGIAQANVNFRAGPSTDFRTLDLIRSGETINIDGRDNTGAWVRGINGTGTVGWAAANFVALQGASLNTLPIVNNNTPFGLAAPAGNAAPEPAVADTNIAVAPIASNTPITGFSYGGHVRGLDDGAANAMRIAGMTWAKFQVRYNQGDDPNAVAGLINDTHAKGFRILLGVVGAPNQLGNGGYNEAYASFVGGLAALGADAIEIWNEPNLDREWPAGQISGAAYTQLLAPAYNAIKANNGNTLVISGAMAPTGAEAAFPGRVRNDDAFLREMVAAGALNFMDCVGIHYNEGIVPPTQNSNDPRGDSYYTRFYNGMVNTYWSITGGQRPLCFTELGYLTPEGFPPLPGGFAWAGNVTVAQQAAWLDQVMQLARNSGRVRLVIVWNVNFRQYDADPMAGYAMIRPDGSCPACVALGN